MSDNIPPPPPGFIPYVTSDMPPPPPGFIPASAKPAPYDSDQGPDKDLPVWLRRDNAFQRFSRGLERGATFGLNTEVKPVSDWAAAEIKQGLGYNPPSIRDLVAGKAESPFAPPTSTPADIYQASKAAELAKANQARQEFSVHVPVLGDVSIPELAGGFASVGGAGSATARGGGYLSGLWDTAKTAAPMGAVSGFTEGNGTLGERAADAGTGAAMAAAFAAGLHSLTSRAPPDPRLEAKTAAAQAAQEENINIPRAAVADSMWKKTAGAVADMPVVGTPLKDAARATTDQIGARTADIANDYAQTGAASANRSLSGNNVRDAIVDYIESGSSKVMNRAYKPFDDLMQGNTNTFQLPATTARAQQLVNGLDISAAGRRTNQAAIANIEDDLTNPNGLTVGQIRNLRTTVGTLLDDKLRPEAGTQEPALRNLYGSLTQDLHSATAQAGGPQALQALQKADALNAQMVARRQALNKIVGKSGDKSGENVFDNIIEMAKDTGKSANLDTLSRARRSVPPETWNDMSSTFIRRMGIDPKTGEYSADRALSAVGKLSPEGRTLLFNSTGRPDLARSLNNLSLVNQQFSELTKMGNPSGTGGITFLTSSLGLGSVFAPAAAASGAGTLAGIYGWSKYMASPVNVDRMTRTLQARLAYARNPNPITAQRVAQTSSALAQSIKSQQNAQNAQNTPAY